MKIVIATPLYPPEIYEPAPYSKRLAELLSNQKHSVTVITYSVIPEEINGVKIVSINKNRILPIRLFLFFKELLSATYKNDVVYIQNGASVELPMIFAKLLTKKPFFIHLIDRGALKRSKKNTLLKKIHQTSIKFSKETIKENPVQRPEITPFKKDFSKEIGKYEKSWEEHVNLLIKKFKNV